jgi:hypothetical protein
MGDLKLPIRSRELSKKRAAFSKLLRWQRLDRSTMSTLMPENP